MDDLDLIAPALRAAHEALTQLDDLEMSPGLRRIARLSGTRLPRPMAAALAAELDSNEWLRGRILEWWEEAGREELEEVAALVLERPENWRSELARLGAEERLRVAEATSDDRARDSEALRKKVDGLESAVGAARDQVRVLQAELAGSAKRAAAEERAKVSGRMDKLREELAHSEAKVRQAEETIASLQASVTGESQRIRVSHPDSGAPARSRSGFGVGAPLAVARTLDQIVESAVRVLARQDPIFAPRDFRLGSGIRPDHPAAVGELLTWESPLILDVDGFNLLHEMGWDVGQSGRQRVEDLLRQIQRVSKAPMAVVVYWDTTEPEERFRLGGIDIRYVSDADDCIHQQAKPGRVLFSNDRLLRERYESAGGVALWARALADWARSR